MYIHVQHCKECIDYLVRRGSTEITHFIVLLIRMDSKFRYANAFCLHPIVLLTFTFLALHPLYLISFIFAYLLLPLSLILILFQFLFIISGLIKKWNKTQLHQLLHPDQKLKQQVVQENLNRKPLQHSKELRCKNIYIKKELERKFKKYFGPTNSF